MSALIEYAHACVLNRIHFGCPNAASLFSGTERTGTDRNSTLKHGTDQASKMHAQDISPLPQRRFSHVTKV